MNTISLINIPPQQQYNPPNLQLPQQQYNPLNLPLQNQIIAMPWISGPNMNETCLPFIREYNVGGGTTRAFIIENAAETIEYFAKIIFKFDWNSIFRRQNCSKDESDNPEFEFLKLYHFPSTGYQRVPENQKIFYNNYILYTKSKYSCQLSDATLLKYYFQIYGEEGYIII